jgi:CxxC-x17-CxxC domain-containing protein
MSYQDKTLTCVDCGAEFVFTANEQAFYAERGFTNEPKRCSACRQSRKASRGGSSGAGYSSNGGYAASGGYSSGGSAGGGGYGGRREMHTVQCSNCGGEARVPFVPRGDKPVYCSDCFSQMRGGYSRAGRY